MPTVPIIRKTILSVRWTEPSSLCTRAAADLLAADGAAAVRARRPGPWRPEVEAQVVRRPPRALGREGGAQ
eukprot:2248749-Pyramimonas_sp.AAC.1